MTTAVETIETEDAQRLALRRVCAYLKGIIVGYATHQGRSYDGKVTSPDFEQGVKDGVRFLNSNRVTYVHILHNRLRHDRPHRTGGRPCTTAASESDSPHRFDDDHIQYQLWEDTGWTDGLNKTLEKLGVDVKALLDKVAS